MKQTEQAPLKLPLATGGIDFEMDEVCSQNGGDDQLGTPNFVERPTPRNFCLDQPRASIPGLTIAPDELDQASPVAHKNAKQPSNGSSRAKNSLRLSLPTFSAYIEAIECHERPKTFTSGEVPVVCSKEQGDSDLSAIDN